MRISRFLLASRLNDGALSILRRVVAGYWRCPEIRATVTEPGPMAVVLSEADESATGVGRAMRVDLAVASERLVDLLRLTCPPPHPEVGSNLVVIVGDRLGDSEKDVRQAARLLHENALAWLVANGSEVTREALTQPLPGPTSGANQSGTFRGNTSDQLPVIAARIKPDWEKLARGLMSSGFRASSYRRLPEDLPDEKPMHGYPDPWLQRRLGDGRGTGWAQIDLLGLFVPPPGSYSPNLAPGIHLFLPRIAAFAARMGCLESRYELAWFVFLHELTHCHLYCQGRVRWPSSLKAIDFEEAFCEAIASLSLRFGVDPFAGVRCPTFPGRWRVSRERKKEQLYPYSWFVSLLPVILRLGPEAARNAVLGLGRELERTVDDPGRRALLLEDVLEVLEGKASAAVASAIVRSWRQRGGGRNSRSRPSSERDFGVHLWGACE